MKASIRQEDTAQTQHRADIDERSEESAKQPIDASAWLSDVQHLLEEQVRARPYAAIMAAGCVGYVLGGGVPSWSLRLLMQTGGRTLLTQTLGPMLADLLLPAQSQRLSSGVSRDVPFDQPTQDKENT